MKLSDASLSFETTFAFTDAAERLSGTFERFIRLGSKSSSTIAEHEGPDKTPPFK